MNCRFKSEIDADINYSALKLQKGGVTEQLPAFQYLKEFNDILFLINSQIISLVTRN